jgi:signal peptidase
MGKREYDALAFIIIIIILLICENTGLISILGSSVYLYYYKPIFWLLLACFIWKKPRTRFKGKLKLYKFILLWSAICGIVYISVYFAGGFLDGIGGSPYAKSIEGILTNVLSFGSVLVMMEWVRNYIINRVKKKYVILFSIIVIVVFSLYKLNLRILASVQTWQQAVEYIAEYAIPEIMNNILLTYLVYIGGAYPAIIYTAITNIPVWLVPVLPNLAWITKAFIGIIMPVAFIIVLRQVYKKESKELKLREQKAEKPYAWIGVSIFSILVIWFAVGVFPIFPTVILTGSMEPAIFPGDVAIMQKVDGSSIKVGDVIQYWKGDVFIIHRVIHIESTGEFKTKGDNNSAPDSQLVTPGQVKGKMVVVIPKIGYLSLLFRTHNQTLDKAVEF